MKKIFLTPGNPDAAGIHQQYPIEDAAWIWSEDDKPGTPTFARFSLTFTALTEPMKLHVSGDQRYELLLDGKLISRGPDAGDKWHWSFASYEIPLTAGEHTFEAIVWCLGNDAPLAHHSHAAGFILAGEGAYADLINTGKAPWKAEVLDGISFDEKRLLEGAHYIGSAAVFDGRDFPWEPKNPKSAIITEPPLEDWCWRYGMRLSDRRFQPSGLPDQKANEIRTGCVRAIVPEAGEAGEATFFPKAVTDDPAIATWNALLKREKSVTIPANSSLAVLWDLENYYCGYPALQTDGGNGAQLTVEWAESLFETAKAINGDRTPRKGQRSVIAEKYFVGFGDTFIPDGGKQRNWHNYWWRSGRYMLLRIKTYAEAVTIKDWSIQETRLPLNFEGQFSSSDESLPALFQLCQRGLEMCAHETFVDCPYYEQLMYIGDGRLQALCLYATVQDASLQRRALNLVDWSRATQGGGWTASRYPSRMDQIIPTFSLIWISMVRDHYDWRGEADFIKGKLPAVRAVLDRFADYKNERGLLEKIPCWQFVDWCSTWDTGYPPGAMDGVSSVINLLYAWTLQNAAYLESHLGDSLRADLLLQQREAILKEVHKCFWDTDKKMLADDEAHTSFSQHGQTFALLNDFLDEDEKDAAFNAMQDPSLHQATVYFRHYLFACSFQQMKPDTYFSSLGDWWGMLKADAHTPWERPEPSRSDCHAWGSHPWFWAFTGLAGIHPSAPEFAEVRIAPQPGSLNELSASMPHPKGTIKLSLTFEGAACRGKAILPETITGTFIWRGEEIALQGGENIVEIK
ncbi:hypothetical protein [Rubellicoccus peritrichatus]|uniref:Alpha-L-rhamnosidase six-hairpin glycosidase domain-containing protein n=1 Tax=Rubellicoccus peritrichatus TaxID=3080537 RepID=A0AAQ3QU79_9BACT|nr:hypothetical protein [Puniceicoccus sp. CR14]WOO39362.1 hypothetical protein RZN69_12125 [Puniceicoccus sp. CR14]